MHTEFVQNNLCEIGHMEDGEGNGKLAAERIIHNKLLV
jgi:hypothetical protein